MNKNYFEMLALIKSLWITVIVIHHNIDPPFLLLQVVYARRDNKSGWSVQQRQ